MLKFVRFREMYNMFQINNINILLVQNIFFNDEYVFFFEFTYFSISIITNKSEIREKISIIINNKIIEWINVSSNIFIVTIDSKRRFLMCKIKSKKKILIIINIYSSIEFTHKITWLKTILENLKQTSIFYSCDVIANDFNQSTQKINRRARKSSVNKQITILNKLFTKFEKNECDYIDEWRDKHFNLIIYIFFRKAIEIFRINKIYLRSKLMKKSFQWNILITKLSIDHYAISVSINSKSITNKKSNRWKFNFFLLKIQIVQNQIKNAIESLSSDNSLEKWVIFKTFIKTKLQNKIRNSQRFAFKLQKNINKRRIKLWKKCKHDALNRDLKMKIEILKTQKQCLVEWRNHNYSYNALIKHLILNKKFIKWFYSKIKQNSYHNIDNLKNEREIIKTSFNEFFETIADYYQKLYFRKLSNMKIRKKMLNIMINKINIFEQANLIASLTKKNVKISMFRSITRKFSNIDDLIIEFYKRFAKRSKKKKRFFSLSTIFITRLTVVLNQIFKKNKLIENWTNDILTLLFKNKNEKNDLKNYKSFTMMNVNYKILTKILMQRFIKTFDFAIESHQSTYIFEKFIDDNVRIIQTIIAKYRSTLQNVIIVFFDQKKIFDRVNHEFLWAILKKFDISIQFIFWVKFLYVDVKIIIYINDHQSKRMTIKCEIKQNDFLNCSLFVIMIEILICYILQNTRISKIVIKSLTIKFTMFVDDITIILRNQKKNQRFNWDFKTVRKSIESKNELT